MGWVFSRAVRSLVKVELFFNCMSTCLCTAICESEVVVFGCMPSCAEVESRCVGTCLLLCSGVVVFVCVCVLL